MSFTGYDACYRISGGDQPGTADLARFLKDQFPQTSYSIYSPRKSTANSSVWSIHACGRAIDLFVPSIEYGNKILALLLADPARYGSQGIIWNRKRYDRQSPRGRVYTGPNPHTDHLHIEQDTGSAWNLRYANYQNKEEPVATYRTVRNVPEESNGAPKAWAKEVIDDGIAAGVINITDTNPDDWEKPLTYGTLWTLLDRLRWPVGTRQ